MSTILESDIILCEDLLQAKLFDQILGTSPLVDKVEDETDIHTNATLKAAVETDVATHSLPVSIESQAYETAFAVEHGTARVATRNVVVADEAEVHVACALVGITPKIAFLHQGHDVVLELVILYLPLLGSFLEQALRIGVIIVMRALGGIILNKAIAQAHAEVGIAVVRRFLIHFQESLSQHVLIIVDDAGVLALPSCDFHELVRNSLGIDESHILLAQSAVGQHFINAGDVCADGLAEQMVLRQFRW